MQKAAIISIAAGLSACVAVQTLPDPKGAIKPGQRLVVLVTQAPGPWIVSSADNKAESAAKISPLGVFVQNMQDEKTLGLSKEIAQYLPRPRYDQPAEAALVKFLKGAHNGPVQTFGESGLDPALWRDWYRAKDTLDWRRRYYAPDPDAPAPRNFSKVLALDDAAVVDVNISFGTSANDDGSLLPALSAATRVYQASTDRLLLNREDFAVDKSSAATLTEIQLQPGELTRRLEALAAGLGQEIGLELAKAFALTPPMGAGLVDFSKLPAVSTAPAPGSAPKP